MQRARPLARDTRHLKLALFVSALLASTVASAQEPGSSSATLERIQANGKITMGYFSDAVPLSYKNQDGKPDGYAVALCQEIVADIKSSLKLQTLATELVLVGSNERFSVMREGRVDLLCGPSVPTLSRRGDVSFSIPILVSGVGVLLRSDAPHQFREALEGRPRTSDPVWRGSPGIQALQERTFVVVTGTTAEKWAKERRSELKINSTVTSVSDPTAGALEVREGRADALFGEQSILLNLAKQNPSQLTVPDRLFTIEPLALAVPRGDEDFRLLVDRTLSRLYRSGQIDAIYEKYFGTPDENVKKLFRILALPE
jgi:polar amino acid transport system substrate-binding protein